MKWIIFKLVAETMLLVTGVVCLFLSVHMAHKHDWQPAIYYVLLSFFFSWAAGEKKTD